MERSNQIFLVLFTFSFFIYFLSFNHNPTQTTIYSDTAYDEFRNLAVVSGILQNKVPTLLGLNYWQSPPVPYYLDALVAWLGGLNPQQASNILMPLLGGLTIGFTFLLSKDVLGSEENGFIASVITGLLPYVFGGFLVFVSDPFVLFFAVLSFYLLLVKPNDNILLGINLGLGLLCKITFAPVIIIVIAFYYLNKQSVKGWLLTFVTFFLVGLPYYAYRLLNTTQGYFGLYGDSSTFLTIQGVGSANTPVSFSQLLSNLPSFYPWVVVLITLIGFALIYKAVEPQRTKMLVLSAFIVLFLGLSVISQYKDFRYYISILPALVIIGVYGLDSVSDCIRTEWRGYYKEIVVGATLGCLAILSYGLLAHQGTWDSQTAIVNQLHINPGQVYLSNGNSMELGYNAGLNGIYVDKFTGPQDFIKYDTQWLVNNGTLEYYEDALNGSFEVEIKDSMGDSVSGAIISLPSLNWVSRSNALGQASIPFLPSNWRGQLVIEAWNKQPQNLDVQAGPNGEFTIKEWIMQPSEWLVNGLSEYRY